MGDALNFCSSLPLVWKSSSNFCIFNRTDFKIIKNLYDYTHDFCFDVWCNFKTVGCAILTFCVVLLLLFHKLRIKVCYTNKFGTAIV